jgi:hypothetical protein
MVLGIADRCTYTGAAPIFADHDVVQPGSRFVVGEGEITVTCEANHSYTVPAIKPTGVVIEGFKAISVSKPTYSNIYSAHLVAPKLELDGKPYLEWALGADCAEHANFGGVSGSQDTGGPDRWRTLLPVSPGTCTVKVTATTGDASYENFKPETFSTELVVTIKK